MEKTDFIPFVDILLTLAECYDLELTSVKQAEYFDALLPFPLEAVRSAAVYCRDHGGYFPRINEMRDAARMFKSRITDPARQLPESTCSNLPPHLKAEYDRDAARVYAMMSTKETRQHKLDAMASMERAYPGFGWGVARDEYEVMSARREAAATKIEGGMQ